jgi:hypothetical protein
MLPQADPPRWHPPGPARPGTKRLHRLLCALPAIAVFLSGCSNSFAPAVAASTPITSSPEIATGAWSIGGISATGGSVSPIGGFYGALTASGTAVSGAFDVATSTPGTTQPSTCAPNIGFSPAIMSGTASNGTLTLDSSFNGNQFHLTAQLSSDRRSILSGTFVVTGPCATTAANLFGYQTAPITGTYVGTSVTTTGATKLITATLVQADSYSFEGEIPVTGTVLFQGTNCSATMELNGSYVTGELSWFEGYTANPKINDALMLGDDDSQNSQYSAFITVAPWSYNSSTCGTETQNTLINTVLTRQ